MITTHTKKIKKSGFYTDLTWAFVYVKRFSLGYCVRDVLHLSDFDFEGFLSAEKAEDADPLADGL